MPAAADPAKAPGADRFDDARQDRAVARPPYQAGANHDRLQSLAVGRPHRLLGHRLGRAVVGLGVGTQRRRLVDADQRLAGHGRRLGTDVHQAAHAGLAARVEHISRAVHVAAHELLARPPFEHRGGRVEGDLAALRAGAQRVRLGQVPARRLGARVRDALGGGVRPRQRPHATALGDEPPDQPAADEARATRDEGRTRVAHDDSPVRGAAGASARRVIW